MGYFDKITEASFKTGSNGESIYFPNGILGKGRLVQDPARKAQLFKYHKRLHKYLIPFSILYGLIIGLGNNISLESLMPILIIGSIVFIRQRYLIRGLPIYNEKLTVKEVASTASKAFHPAFLILMVLNGAALIVVSIAMPFILNEPINEIFTLVIGPFVLGVLSLAVYIYLYKIKKSNKSVKQTD